MALNGVIVSCGKAGGQSISRNDLMLFGEVEWTETPVSGTASTNAAPATDSKRSVFRVYASADARVAVGPSPPADPKTGPHHFVPGGQIVDVTAVQGDKFSWVFD